MSTATVAVAIDGARLRRIQAGAQATLALGIGASLAANMLAADPSLAGRVIAAWSPIALLLTVELLSRVPMTSGWLSRLRVGAAATIAAIAAWVSYWHMVEVAQTFGEAPVAAHLLPFSVDGLVIVASVCLVEISDRLTASPMVTSAESDEAPTSPAQTVRPPRARQVQARNGSRPPVNRSVGKGSTAEAVRRLAAEHPSWTQAELAEAAGCSVRTVRRHMNTPDNHRPAESSVAVEASAAAADEPAPDANAEVAA